MTKELLPFCKCGCGEYVTKPENRFINGHNIRGDGNPMNNPKSRKKASISHTNVPMANATKAAISRYALKEKDPLPNGFEIDKSSKTVTNKNCSAYLGCYIAEQILSKIFKDVKVMPLNNHGYDIICNRDKKIDIKSSATGHKGSWHFDIVRNKIANYFLLIAFDNRDDLNPVHLWLIPGHVVNHLTGIEIHKDHLAKWAQYEQPLDKVILCCDEMKEEI